MNRWTLVAAALAAVVALPSSAAACSRDDKSYFDGFPDTSCLALPLTQTEVDTLGGLRLKTNGTPVQAVWDSRSQFENGITYSGELFAPVGRSTLAVVGGDDPTGALELPKTTMPLTVLADPVLSPAASTWQDSDGVVDPSVIKVDNLYVMYYAGIAEDGAGPAIFRLESQNGTTWTRPATPAEHVPVLVGSGGGFDEHGVFGPDVVYDPTDTAAPYKMWYSGRGDVFDQIGYATSTNGTLWTKFDGADADALPDPVVTVGLPGSQDSFAAAHPTVLRDGGLWKMWYEGDDSTKKSIAYATSTDGKAWSKAGAVIESGTGNVTLGVFAPTVWKDPGNAQSPFKMLVGGRAETGQGIKTKLINYTSADGLTWVSGSIALNTASFASTNLGSPEIVFLNGAIDKLYYSGNSAGEATPDPRDRIGVANSTGGTAQTIALDIAPRSAAFDAREVFGLASVDPGGTPDLLPGVYAGLREDGVPRLGGAKSDAAGTAWTKVAGPQSDGSILPIGGDNQFDEDGHRDPHLVYIQNCCATNDDYFLYFTGIEDGVETIGISVGQEASATTRLPDHSTWSNPGNDAFFGLGTTGLDDLGVSHPSVVQLGMNSWAMYYTAQGSTAGTSIGRATASSHNGGFAGRAAITLNAATAGTPAHTCDLSGRRDPEAVVIDNLVHLLFVGLENFDHDDDVDTPDITIERTCWAKATNPNGTTFDRMGPVLNPSQVPHQFDETAIAPSSIVADTAGETDVLRVLTTGTDRDGRRRAGYVSTPLPLATAATVGIPNGWAIYQMGDEATAVRDFQRIIATGTGSGTEIWMSVLQPYSSASNLYWSAPFPVSALDVDGEELNFQIGGEDGGVRAVRWQARMRRPALVGDSPRLDKVVVEHADISFFATGSATTTDITPPSEFDLKSWTSLVVTTSLFQPLAVGAAGGTVTVLDEAGTTLATSPLTVPATDTGTADTTVSLAGIDAAGKPNLRVKLDLTSATGQASPLVESLKVNYVATAPGAAPADSDGDGIPDSSDACPTVAGASTAGGCPDADGDGIADAQDACPALAASGKPNGCPDSDGDGVADPNDACPTVPAAGSPNGCPIAMTLATSASRVVYGRSAVLSGTLLRGALPVTGQMVTIFALPVGAAAPRLLGTAVTDVTGKWVLTVKPRLHTTYSVVLTGVASPAVVKISVAHKLALTVKLVGRRATFTGLLGPKHARRYVTIQRKSGTRWVRLTRVRTNRLSKFRFAKSFRKGRYQFRAITGADRQHLAGRSSARRVTVR